MVCSGHNECNRDFPIPWATWLRVQHMAMDQSKRKDHLFADFQTLIWLICFRFPVPGLPHCKQKVTRDLVLRCHHRRAPRGWGGGWQVSGGQHLDLWLDRRWGGGKPKVSSSLNDDLLKYYFALFSKAAESQKRKSNFWIPEAIWTVWLPFWLSYKFNDQSPTGKFYANSIWHESLLNTMIPIWTGFIITTNHKHTCCLFLWIDTTGADPGLWSGTRLKDRKFSRKGTLYLHPKRRRYKLFPWRLRDFDKRIIAKCAPHFSGQYFTSAGTPRKTFSLLSKKTPTMYEFWSKLSFPIGN